MEYDIESILEKYEDDYNPGPRPMNQGPRNMYNQGQLVQPSSDGSRPGYSGKNLTGDKKLIKEWEKTLTDAVKKKDMTKTVGFKTFLDNKFKDKTKVDTIRNRILNQLNYKAKNKYSEIQENFAKSLINDHNNADKILYNRGEIFRITKIDDASALGQNLLKIMGDPKTGMEDINTKINKAFNKIVNGEVVLKKPKNITSVLKNYSLIPQMIGDISGVRNVENIKNALQFNPNFKDKNFVQVFNYLNKSGLAKDFIGSNFDEVFEYAKFRQGGLDVKGLLSYTTRYQNPESNILNFAVRHANRHFRDGTSEESLVKFFKKRADGTKGAPINFENLPRDRDGNRILNLNEVGFEYENKFFHKENLKTKGFQSGLFQEIYDLSGKNRLKVPDPNNPSKKITLQQLLKITGDKLTIGHDEAFGGVKGKPFNGLQLQGGKLNTALFNAYDKIQNKQLRKLILNELQLVVPKGINYETAFINKSIEDAKNIVNNTSDTLYRQAGKNVITNLGQDFLKKSKPFQKETMRVAGLKSGEELKKLLEELCPKGKASGGRIGFKSAGAVLGSGANCGRNHMSNLLKNGTGSTEERNLIRQVMKVGFNFAKGTGKVAVNLLDPKEFLKLKNWVGKPAMAFMAGVEGLDVADRVIRQGIPINEALGEKWTKFLQPKSLQEYQVEGMREKNVLSSPASKRYAKGIEISNDLTRAYDQLEMLEKGETAKFKKTGDAERIADLKKLIRTKEKKYYDYLYQTDEKGNVLGDGELDFKKDYNEYRALTKTGRDFTDLDVFGGMNDMGTDEMSGLKIKKDYFPMYEIGTDKIPSEQELAFDATLAKEPFVRERLVPLPQLKDFEYQNKELPTQYRINAENVLTDQGVLPPRTSLSEIPLSGKEYTYDLLKDLTDDYNRTQKSKEARMYPAFGGSQFSEGGITELRSKYEYKK